MRRYSHQRCGLLSIGLDVLAAFNRVITRKNLGQRRIQNVRERQIPNRWQAMTQVAHRFGQWRRPVIAALVLPAWACAV